MLKCIYIVGGGGGIIRSPDDFVRRRNYQSNYFMVGLFEQRETE